jgi:hypothetical protein
MEERRERAFGTVSNCTSWVGKRRRIKKKKKTPA